MELTPKSASNPSRLACGIWRLRVENSSPWSSHCGICSPNSSLSASNRTLAISSASGSRSKPINRPFPPNCRAMAVACPANPRVASTYVPPARTFRYRIASFKRTGTCRSLPCAPPGGPTSNSKVRQILLVVRRQRFCLHPLLQLVVVLHFEVGLHSENHYIPGQPRRLAQDLRQ